jgi:hypothetical protein
MDLSICGNVLEYLGIIERSGMLIIRKILSDNPKIGKMEQKRRERYDLTT